MAEISLSGSGEGPGGVINPLGLLDKRQSDPKTTVGGRTEASEAQNRGLRMDLGPGRAVGGGGRP